MVARVVKSVLLFLVYILLPFTAISYEPCNEIFGWECSKHHELWNGVALSKTTNCLCPPYNKTDRSGCLKQFGLPGPFNMVYNRYCAEESQSTNFFTPKIHVRVQTCNVGCWTLSDHLRGDGECTVYPGAFGIPLLRLCARVALPDDPITETSADDGYTYGWHLNYEGAPTLDPVYQGDDGQPVYMARPKVCAYWDPSFWDALANYMGMVVSGGLAQLALLASTAEGAGVSSNLIESFRASANGDTTGMSVAVDATGLRGNDFGSGVLRGLQANFQPDLWDLNPVQQSSHFHQGGIFIVFQWIISLFKMGLSGQNLVKSLIGMMPGDSMWYFYWIGVLYWLLVAIVYIGEEIIVPVLEYLGQINNVVAATLGCVLVPLGPNPPPYCNPLSPVPSNPKIYQICPTIYDILENKLVTIPSTVRDQCVNSTKPNNVIHNSVRVAFDELISLCAPIDEPSDTCVRIHDINLAASSIHARTNNLDVIKKICSGPNPKVAELPCIESPRLLSKCGANTSLCGDGIRVVYATNGVNVAINSYYDTEATDCSPLNNSMCQKIWGVNIGDFKDLVVEFPPIENTYTDRALDSPQSVLLDTDGSTVGVYARIVRKQVQLQSLATIDPYSIHVFDSFHNIVGSVKRPVPPKPLVFECGVSSAACTSSFLSPAMVAKLKIGTYSTEGVLSVVTSRNTGAKINLAGFDYDSFATDEQYSTIPFSGSHSINPMSIYGTYKDDIAPYDSKGANPTGSIYLKGLEYLSGKYLIGGEQMCLSGYKFDDCLTGKTNTNCILSSLVNSDYIRCTKFINNVIAPYSGVTLCTPSQQSSYVKVTSITEPRLAPAVGNNIVDIYRETNTTGKYCYDYTGSAAKGELCRLDNSIESRVIPSKDIANPLGENDYYNYSKTQSINSDLLIVRNKTAIETGLCVDIPPPPSCPAIDAATADTGYAIWKEAAGGTYSEGTCMTGSMPISSDSLKRYCIIDKNTGNTSLEPMTENIGCGPPKCNITLGTSTYWWSEDERKVRLDGVLWYWLGDDGLPLNFRAYGPTRDINIREELVNPMDVKSSKPSVSHTIDNDGSHIITFYVSNLGLWVHRSFVMIPINYTPGPTSNPTITIKKEHGLSTIGVPNYLTPGLNKWWTYFWAKGGGQGKFTITIKCNDYQ
jgi:hypothetical protein